ncbi:MAG: hypothetical protein K6U08_04185 [Firmicutes bacterium]|nr:hypothetical protein [Bacillota bacterium]
MNAVFLLVALAVLFVMFDEWQRLSRRVRSLEERLDRLDPAGRPWLHHERAREASAGRDVPERRSDT